MSKTRRAIYLSGRLPIKRDEKGEVVANLAGGVAQSLGVVMRDGDLWTGPVPMTAEEKQQERVAIEKNNGFHPDRYDTAKGGIIQGYPIDKALRHTHRNEVTLPYAWPGGHGLSDIFNGNIERVGKPGEQAANLNKLFRDYYKACDVGASHIAEQVKKPGYENAQIVIHDYDNVGVGHELKRRGVKNSIGFFNHTPVPKVEHLEQMKVDGRPLLDHPGTKEYFLRMAKGFDFIGLQTNEYTKNLLDIYKRIDPSFETVDSKKGIYKICGNEVGMKGIPIGVAPEEIKKEADASLKDPNPEQDPRHADRLMKEEFPGKKVVIGFGRNDYTKGVRERLAMIDRFFEKNGDKPEFQDTAFFIQLEKTRQGSKDFDDNQKRMEALTDAMEKKYPDRFKVIYGRRPHEDCMALCRHEQTAGVLETSIADGMNLVPKEFAAATHGTKKPGSVIISDGMGTAEQFGKRGAYIITGLRDLKDKPLFKTDDGTKTGDLETTKDGHTILDLDPESRKVIDKAVDQMEKGLSVSDHEAKARSESLYKNLQDENIFDWGRKQLEELDRIEGHKNKREKFHARQQARKDGKPAEPKTPAQRGRAYMKELHAARVGLLNTSWDSRGPGLKSLGSKEAGKSSQNADMAKRIEAYARKRKQR